MRAIEALRLPLSLRRPWLLLSCALFLMIAAAVLAMAGFAHASGGTEAKLPGVFDPYLHRPSGDMADPINLVFRGSDAETVAQAVQRVLGWPNVAGSPMTFSDQAASHPTAYQFGFDLGDGSRLHMRIESVEKLSGQSYVLVGVHRDDSVFCGHVGVAFNSVRDTVAQAFARLGYDVSSLPLQNTLPARQCDGSFTFGDGKAAMIDLASHKLPATTSLFPVGGLLGPLYLDLHSGLSDKR